MNIKSLTTKKLKDVEKLVESREKHEAAISEIDSKIEEILGENGNSEVPVKETPQPKKRGRKPAAAPKAKKGEKRSRKGSIQTRVVEFLTKKGEPTHITEIANALKISKNTLAVWTSNNKDKVPGLKKVAPATFQYTPPKGEETPETDPNVKVSALN